MKHLIKKLSFAYLLFGFLSINQVFSQPYDASLKSIARSKNPNFIITRIGNHGFSKCKDTSELANNDRCENLCYTMELEIENNTNLKLKKTKVVGKITELSELFLCNYDYYHDGKLWMPHTKIKVTIKPVVFETGMQSTFFSQMSMTPRIVPLKIYINAYNVDAGFNELIDIFDILDDWKKFQIVLGYRD